MTITGHIDMEPTEQQSEAGTRICVVIDTNIWRSELLLRTARGAALLCILRQSGGGLGMPEVIEREIVKHAVAVGTECIDSIESNFRMLIALMGTRSDYKVPTAEEIAGQARSRLDELKRLFEVIPF